MAQGDIKPFCAKKQHGLRKLWFYLINLVFILIISHHSHMCPSPFFTEFSLPRHDHDGLGLFQHCMISTRDIMNLGSWHGLVSCLTWIWLRKGHFCQHVDTLITCFSWIIHSFRKQTYPQLTHTFQLAFENILHKDHTMFFKMTVNLLQWWWLAMGTQLDNNNIVHYEDDYLKHHM